MNFRSANVPRHSRPLVCNFQFGSLSSFGQLCRTRGRSLTTVVVRPSNPTRSVRKRFRSTSADFLTTLGRTTRSINTLLIFSRVIAKCHCPAKDMRRSANVVPSLAYLKGTVTTNVPLSTLINSAEVLHGDVDHICCKPAFGDRLCSFTTTGTTVRVCQARPITRFISSCKRQLGRKVGGFYRALRVSTGY